MAVLGGRRGFVTVKYLWSSGKSPTKCLQENCCHFFSLHSPKEGLHAFLVNMLNCRISSFSQWKKLDKPMDVSMATEQVTTTESTCDLWEKPLLQPKIKLTKHQCLIVSRCKWGNYEHQCDKCVLRLFSICFQTSTLLRFLENYIKPNAKFKVLRYILELKLFCFVLFFFMKLVTTASHLDWKGIPTF